MLVGLVMKTWRFPAGSGAAVIALVVVGWVVLRWVVNNERERIYSTAWISAHLAEPVDSLVSVGFNFCGEVHRYSVQQLMDTTGENMQITERSMPCPISITYEFHTGRTLVLSADSFDCRRCSGRHAYALWRDSVSYRYWP